MTEDSELIVREATADDIDTLVEFRRQLQDFMTELNPNLFGLASGWESKKREQYAGCIDDPKRHLLLACSVDATPMGMGLASIVGHPDFVPPEFGYIDDLWVTPQFRRGGVGSRIVEELMAFFSRNSIDHITLNYVVGNPEAERFWHKRGFEPVVIAANRSPGAGKT